jgi:hypothetical protein
VAAVPSGLSPTPLIIIIIIIIIIINAYGMLAHPSNSKHSCLASYTGHEQVIFRLVKEFFHSGNILWT